MRRRYRAVTAAPETAAPDAALPERLPPVEDEGIGSLRAVFRERRISLASMDRPLRLATGAALASLVGVALLIALRDIPAPDVVLGRSGGRVVEVSAPLFIATLVLLALGLAYLLTGAVLASWPVAVATLALITAVIGLQAGAFGPVLGGVSFLGVLPGWARWISRALLAALWLVAAATWAWDRRTGRPATRPLRLTVLAGYFALFAGYLVVLRIAAPTAGGLDLYPGVIGLVMVDIVMLVHPVLLAAAVDFGEWGGLLGERVTTAVRRKSERGPALLAGILAATLAGYGYLEVAHGTPLVSGERIWRAGRSVLILAVTLGIVVLVGRALALHRRRWPTTLNFAVVFAVCAAGSYLIAPVSAVLAHEFDGISAPVEQVVEGRFTSGADVVAGRGGAGPTAFTVLIPRGWLHRSTSSLEVWTNYAVPGAPAGQSGTAFERVAVTSLPASVTAADIAHASPGMSMTGPEERTGPWTSVPVTTDGLAGIVWSRPDPQAPGTSYIVEALVKGAPLAGVEPELRAIADSFRPAGEPAAVLPAGAEAQAESDVDPAFDRTQLVDVGISLAVLLCLLAAYAVTGRRWPARMVAAVLLLGLTTTMTVVYFADSLGRVLVGEGTRWPYVSKYGLLTGFGVLGLLAVGATARWEPVRRRRLLTGLSGLLATTWALEGMDLVYDSALRASRVSAWAAVTVLVAAAWDVTMSGESLTNHGTRHAPRASRVLAFLGYVVLLAATVLFYSAQRAVGSGEATEAFFEPESVTRDGLFRIALPVAVLLFLLRFGRRHLSVSHLPETE